MKRTIVLVSVFLTGCSLTGSGSSIGSPTATGEFPILPSAQPASADQAAAAKQAITAALQQIRQGQGVLLTGDSYIDDDGMDIPTRLEGQIAPDGALDLHISVEFSQGTDIFEVRTVNGHEYTWDPSSSAWNTATLGEPAASGISAVDPLFMNYPTQMSAATVGVAPDDLVNGTATAVYEVTVTSSDQNDQVTSRLWLAKDSGALLQEGISLSNQVELPGGLGFNGSLLIQFQPANGTVSISPPPGG